MHAYMHACVPLTPHTRSLALAPCPATHPEQLHVLLFQAPVPGLELRALILQLLQAATGRGEAIVSGEESSRIKGGHVERQH